MAMAPASLAVLSTGGATPKDMQRMLVKAQEHRLVSQKTGNAKSEMSSLMGITTLHLLQAGLPEALEAAGEALAVARKAKDAEREAITQLTLGYLRVASGDEQGARDTIGEVTRACQNAKDAKWAEPASTQLERLQLVAETLAGASGKVPLATSLLALAHISVATGNLVYGLAAAKEAMVLFEEVGDERGVAAAGLALAEGHIAAGVKEDGPRQAAYMPMATRHASAAGAAAERANGIFRKLGIEGGTRITQAILDMQRIQMTASCRKQIFHYPTWHNINP